MRQMISDRIFQAALHGAETPELQASLDSVNEMIEEFEPKSELQKQSKDLEIENFFSNLGWMK